MEFDQLTDLLGESLKKLFFPEEWLRLDRKFSKSEMFSLLLIDKRKEITMTELAESIHSPMSTATGVTDRLVKNGYLVRARSEQDRRIVVVRLTEKGEREIAKLKELISGYIDKIAEELTQEEIQSFIQIVSKILGILNEESAQKPTNRTNEDAVWEIEID